MLRVLSERFSDVRVLAFDIFGTVVDWRTGVIEEFAAIARERNLKVDPGLVADDWRAATGRRWTRSVRGRYPGPSWTSFIEAPSGT
jgi:2-haloacid dehalogenase